MILTVTLNPSIDISYKLEDFIIDDVNRCKDTSKTPGGKGLNVSRVLKQLGTDISATGFIGGYNGEFLKAELEKLNIDTKFLNVKGNTRNCIAVLHGGKQTEILESGDYISEEEQREFLRLFEDILTENSIITISGSMPLGIPADYYEKLIEIANRKGNRVIFDASGDNLRNIILNSENKPYAIKPNETEIQQIENKNLETEEKLIEYLKSDIFKGIELIIVSMGAEGALVKYKENIYNVEIPKIDVINPVGSGDSTVAGIAYGLNKDLDIEDTIKYGMACGILNTMEEKTGYIKIDNLDDIFGKIEITKI